MTITETAGMMLRGQLEARGVWAEARAQLEAVYERREPGECLVVLGRKG